MAAGNHEFWIFAAGENIHNINHNALTLVEFFSWNLLALWQDCFGLVDLNSCIALNLINFENRNRDDLIFLIHVFLCNLAFFCFADCLTDNMFCRLCCNAAKLFCFQWNLNYATDVCHFAVFGCICKGDLGFQIFHFFYNIFANCYIKTVLCWVNFNDGIFAAAKITFDCNCNCVADLFNQVGHWDALFLFQRSQSFKNFIIDYVHIRCHVCCLLNLIKNQYILS